MTRRGGGEAAPAGYDDRRGGGGYDDRRGGSGHDAPPLGAYDDRRAATTTSAAAAGTTSATTSRRRGENAATRYDERGFAPLPRERERSREREYVQHAPPPRAATRRRHADERHATTTQGPGGGGYPLLVARRARVRRLRERRFALRPRTVLRRGEEEDRLANGQRGQASGSGDDAAAYAAPKRVARKPGTIAGIGEDGDP